MGLEKGCGGQATVAYKTSTHPSTQNCRGRGSSMGLPLCLGSSTFQTLKLTTIPIPFRPLVSRTLTLNLLLYRHNCSQRPPFPFQARARAPSAPDVQASPVANSNDKGALFSSTCNILSIQIFFFWQWFVLVLVFQLWSLNGRLQLTSSGYETIKLLLPTT